MLQLMLKWTSELSAWALSYRPKPVSVQQQEQQGLIARPVLFHCVSVMRLVTTMQGQTESLILATQSSLAVKVVFLVEPAETHHRSYSVGCTISHADRQHQCHLYSGDGNHQVEIIAKSFHVRITSVEACSQLIHIAFACVMQIVE